ncbi:MAG: class II histone deacetylase [Pseudomonadota bacterium]
MRLRPEPADDDTLALLHTRDHIAHIRALSDANGGDAGQLTPMGRGSFEIAALAVGGSITALDAVLTGQVQNAYALVRPPGHHALADLAMGFCLFGNVAIAVKKALAEQRVERVAIIDWDVHHGNGTEAAFWRDSRVLTLSIHQDSLFPPDSGHLEANGEGDGAGYAINLPLPPGSGDGAYLAAMDDLVLPALRRYRPDVIVVASGFDAAGVDPLGRMMVSSEGYRAMTEKLMEAADALCDGRLVLSHEGGYSSMYAPYCGLAVMEALTGVRTGIEDPWAPLMADWGGQALQPHQAEMIAATAPLIERVC